MSVPKKVKRDEIEEEQLYSEIYEEEIVEPFNPKDVDIISQPMVISNIVDQLKYEDILLEPDFQLLIYHLLYYRNKTSVMGS